MSQTFLQLKQKLRIELWPAGEAKNLRLAHDAYFVTAMIDIQRWVECLQYRNVSQYPHCSTYWDCAKTVFEAPKGIVQRVFTIANDDWCDRVNYFSNTFEGVDCWSKLLFESTTPLNTDLEPLPQGIKFAEKSTDSVLGRARIGSWAIRRFRMYLAPWIQSNETVVVEWDGKKGDWTDTDVLNTSYWTPTVEEAIKLYVRAQHELYFGDKQQSILFKGMYDDKISDLMFDCREETRQQQAVPCENETVGLTQAEIDDDTAPVEETDYVTCLLGDWGKLGTPLDDVVEQITAIGPRKVITLGDNVYTDDAATLFAKFDFTTLKLAWGNHDWDVAPGDLSALQALVELGNNERYYTVVDGPIQFFILDTDSREPDGGYVDATTSTQASIMGEWLRVQLAMSTAQWKVVIGHHSPYTSEVNYQPGNRWMRWPFSTWGADIYIGAHGHAYEHVIVDGFPYIVCGLGGHSIRGFGAVVAGSQYRYNTDYAFLKSTANCDELKIDLIDRNGTEIYTVTIPA